MPTTEPSNKRYKISIQNLCLGSFKLTIFPSFYPSILDIFYTFSKSASKYLNKTIATKHYLNKDIIVGKTGGLEVPDLAG